VLSVMVGVTKV